MANTQHVQFSGENGDIYYLENQTEDVRDASGKPLSNGGDLSEASVKFTADTTRKLPQSGGRFKAFLGSIVKYLSDLGAAAYLAVANNDTTTQAGFVGDARVLKQHRDAINQLSSELSRKLLDSYTFDGSTPQSVAHNKFYQTIKSLNLANTDYKRLSIVIEAGENNQNVNNYYCYRKTPNSVAFGYYQYTYVEVITLANVSSVIRWTYASGETTDITDYQPVAGAKYSLFYN